MARCHEHDGRPLAGAPRVRVTYSGDSTACERCAPRSSSCVWPRPAPRGPTSRKPSFILIVIDTLRADRLGCYGSKRALTPFLDELAGRSTVFHRAYAQSSWTLPSVVSLFTSTFPSQHRATNYVALVPPQSPTFPELLHTHGYRAAGWSANTMIEAKRGFGRGFDHFQVPEPTTLPGFDKIMFSARAERIHEEMVEWLAIRTRPGEPFVPTLLYVQYMEPHLPYAPSAEDLARLTRGRPLDVKALNDLLALFPKLPALQDVEDVYDAAVTTLDAQLRRLFEELARLHFLEEAVVLVTADHGDEFGDHGGRGHGTTLYDELIRVPLLVLFPGQTIRRDVDDVVSLVDVAPTLLDLAGISPPPSFEGRSFAPMLATDGTSGNESAAVKRIGDQRGRPAFSELLPIGATSPRRHDRTILLGAQKLLVSPDGQLEMFDLAVDPAEAKPITGAAASLPALQATLDALTKRVRAAPSAPVPALEMDEKTRERLKALGYAG